MNWSNEEFSDRIIEISNLTRMATSPSTEAVAAYMNGELDKLITEMRLLTDWSDEQLYDNIIEETELTESEQDYLADKLGIS